jgi:hypothetical protein
MKAYQDAYPRGYTEPYPWHPTVVASIQAAGKGSLAAVATIFILGALAGAAVACMCCRRGTEYTPLK